MPACPKIRLLAAFAVMTLGLSLRAQEGVHPREESRESDSRSAHDSRRGASEEVNQGRFDGMDDTDRPVPPTLPSAVRLGPPSIFESGRELLLTTSGSDLDPVAGTPVPTSIRFLSESPLSGADYGITESNYSDAVRYDLRDVSHQVIGQFLDHQQLALKLGELLSGSTPRRIAIEMPGFTANGSDALATSLTIQLRRIDPGLNVTVPAKLRPDPADRELATTPGPWVEGRTVVIERIPPELGNEQYIATLQMHVRIAGRFRDFTLRIVNASLETVLQFLDRLGIVQRPASAYAQLSLQQLVDEARGDLKRTHPWLDEKSLQVMFVDQAGNTGMAQLRIEATITCS